MSSRQVFRKSRERIVGRVKGSESPSVQGIQYSEEDLVMRWRDPRGMRGNQSVSISPTGTIRLLFKCGTMVPVLIYPPIINEQYMICSKGD